MKTGAYNQWCSQEFSLGAYIDKPISSNGIEFYIFKGGAIKSEGSNPLEFKENFWFFCKKNFRGDIFLP